MDQQHKTARLISGGPAGRPDVLVSDADRETVAGMLSSAFAEGRLTAAEHMERVRAAYEARTSGELGALTADLPDPAGDARKRQAASAPDEVHRCLLICCPPAGIAWLAARRRARRDRGAGAADR